MSALHKGAADFRKTRFDKSMHVVDSIRIFEMASLVSVLIKKGHK